MQTSPGLEIADRLIGFEIPSEFMTPGLVARILLSADGVSDVRPRRLLTWSRGDVHVRFRYRDIEHIVWEPWGDNSSWWIGPENPDAPGADVSALERAFRMWRPPLWRRIGNAVARLSAKR
jgi:hypothetical protein